MAEQSLAFRLEVAGSCRAFRLEFFLLSSMSFYKFLRIVRFLRMFSDDFDVGRTVFTGEEGEGPAPNPIRFLPLQLDEVTVLWPQELCLGPGTVLKVMQISFPIKTIGKNDRHL